MRLALLSFLFLFSFCAVLGSRVKIHNAEGLQQIKTVGLVTQRADQPKHLYHKIIKAAFTKTLLEGLAEKNLFRIVILDTMENENMDLHKFSNVTAVDAILLVNWKLNRPNNMVSDAHVTLRILKMDSYDTLLTARHGTRWGNSYWNTPILPATLLDATTGAINALSKKMKPRP